MENRARFHGCRSAWEPREARPQARRRGTALLALRMESREIEDTKIQDNEHAPRDVDNGKSDIETRKKGGSRFTSMRRSKMRTITRVTREHSQMENLE